MFVHFVYFSFLCVKRLIIPDIQNRSIWHIYQLEDVWKYNKSINFTIAAARK